MIGGPKLFAIDRIDAQHLAIATCIQHDVLMHDKRGPKLKLNWLRRVTGAVCQVLSPDFWLRQINFSPS